MRGIVLEWMLDVCCDQSYDREVFCLSVSYLDRFLSSVSLKKTQLQLSAAVCLLLASKFSQVSPLSLEQLVMYTDNSVTREELITWELYMLDTLHWDISDITPLTVARLMTRHLLVKSEKSEEQLIEQLITKAISEDFLINFLISSMDFA